MAQGNIPDLDDLYNLPDIGYFEPVLDSDINLPKGLIKDFVKKVKIDSPEVFKLGAIYHTLSWCLGRYFKWGNKRINIMILLSSDPGVTRRSTLVGIEKDLRWFAYRKFKHILQTMNPSRKAKHVERGWFESYELKSGTPEGITDAINDAQGTNNYKIDNLNKKDDDHLPFFSWSDAEFGSTLKNYEGILTIASKLKYGESHKFYLSRKVRKSDEAIRVFDNAFATMFAAMQKPELYITDMHIEQGLWRRIIPIDIQPQNIDVDALIPPSKFVQGFEQRKQFVEKLGERLGDRMYKYANMMKDNNTNYLEIDFGHLANEIDKIFYATHRRYKEMPNLESISRVSDWEHLVELTALNALSRDGVKNGVLFITDEDFVLAKDFLNRIDYNRRSIIRRLTFGENVPYKIRRNAIIDWIKTEKPTLQEIYSIDTIPPRHLDELIENLQKTGVLQYLLKKPERKKKKEKPTANI